MAEQLQPRAITLAELTPGMDGFEFMDEFRKHRDWRVVPVIVIAAQRAGIRTSVRG